MNDYDIEEGTTKMLKVWYATGVKWAFWTKIKGVWKFRIEGKKFGSWKELMWMKDMTPDEATEHLKKEKFPFEWKA